MIRVATYNVHKLVGADGKWNADRVLKVISALNADILGIQEFVVDPKITRAPSAEDFAASGGYRLMQQRLRRRNGEYQYNLLLTRMEPRVTRLIDMVLEGREPRGAILADFEIEGRMFRVVNTHLALDPLARRRQLEIVLERNRSLEDMPLVLMGDFNASIPYGLVDRKLRQDFPGHNWPATFPARWPVAATDRIGVHPGSALRSLRAYSREPARIASDHLPLVAEIAFDEAGG